MKENENVSTTQNKKRHRPALPRRCSHGRSGSRASSLSRECFAMMSGEQKDVDTVPLGVLVFVIVLQPCLEVKACDDANDKTAISGDGNEEEEGKG